jgi:Domain of unknown function (DUF4214)
MRKPLLYCVLLAGILTLLPAKQANAGEVWGISIVGYNRESREIFGYSATWLDFDAAYYYDPAVQGELYWQFNNEVPLDSGYSEGFGVFPAQVWLSSSQYLPLTTYSTFSNHFVVAYYTYCYDYCNYYYWYDPFRFDFFGGGDFGGWYFFNGPYFDPYCYVYSQTIYMFSTGATIQTPPDGCFSVGAEFLTIGTPCVPEPTPTPTPPAQCLQPGIRYRTEVANNGIPISNPNASPASDRVPYRNSTVIMAAGTPSGGSYTWSTSSNKVQLGDRADTSTSSQITVKALSKSDSENDVVIDVTYSVPNCGSPRTEHIPMTVQQPKEMRYVRTEYNRRLAPFRGEDGRLVAGWEKRIVWQVYDHLGHPITYRLPVADTVNNDSPNSCRVPKQGEGTLLSVGLGTSGIGEWPHRYADFSPACLRGGNCSVTGYQEYTVNGWVLTNDRKDFTMTCTGIFLEGETSNPPGGSLIPPVPPETTEAFVDNFWVGSLQVLADDASYQSWTNILNGALAQGPSNLLLQARALGRSLFQSTAYASLNRTNEEFVTDLYNAYLGRVPDPGGYAFWLSVLQSDNAQGLNGREHLLQGFELSPEFINLVSSLTAVAPLEEACDLNEEQACYNNFGIWDSDTCSCIPGCNPYDEQSCYASYGWWDSYSCRCYYW